MGIHVKSRFWAIADILGIELEVMPSGMIKGEGVMRREIDGMPLHIPARVVSSAVNTHEAIVLVQTIGNLGFMLSAKSAEEATLCVLDCAALPALTGLLEGNVWQDEAGCLDGLAEGIRATYLLSSSGWTKA